MEAEVPKPRNLGQMIDAALNRIDAAMEPKRTRLKPDVRTKRQTDSERDGGTMDISRTEIV